MSFRYQPPYGSPIEQEFAYHLEKYISQDVEVTPQKMVSTLCGDFIPDFLLTTKKGLRIVIECDGKDFHDKSRDEWRDGMILGDGHADVIYRLPGSGINYYIEDIFYLISTLDPSCISERGRQNLQSLASPEIKACGGSVSQDRYRIGYGDESRGELEIEIRRKIIPKGQRRFWESAYQFAVSIGGGPLDMVIKKYRESNDQNLWELNES